MSAYKKAEALEQVCLASLYSCTDGVTAQPLLRLLSLTDGKQAAEIRHIFTQSKHTSLLYVPKQAAIRAGGELVRPRAARRTA